MRDSLPKRPWKREAIVMNLDDSHGVGTHWVCFRKNGNHVDYFDSYGNLPPPTELLHYLRGNYISHNRNAFQTLEANSNVCGHLCLAFLMQ